MKTCPSCGRESLVGIADTRHRLCEACSVTVWHEGNGFVVEHP